MRQALYTSKLTMLDETLRVELLKLLHKHQLKVTINRLLILVTLLEEDNFHTLDGLMKVIWQRYADVKLSSSSVYGSLKKLVKAGIVERRAIGGKYSYGYRSSSGLLDKLIEIESGKIVDLKHSLLQELKVKIADQYGYNPENCRIEVHAYPDNQIDSKEYAIGN